jgi:hypothetical protein
MFTESLTVRILGDSSDLQRELSSVVSQLEEFQSRLADSGEGSRELSDGLREVGQSGTSLRQLSSQLTAVHQQVQQLSGQTVTLNVQPALASLAQLSTSIQAVIAQLAQLSAASAIAAVSGSGRPTRMPPGFADGGLVEGRAGVDTIPAFLTAGEFVLNRESTQRLGTTFLTALNQGTIGTVSRTQPPPFVTSAVSTTNNHFGGITVNVTEPGGVNDVIRDLRMQGASLRVRRG